MTRAVAKSRKAVPVPWTFAVSGDFRNCGDVVMPAIAAGVHQNWPTTLRPLFARSARVSAFSLCALRVWRPSSTPEID
jgi:hypothetical protein